MHDAWALKPAFLRLVHHPRAPRMQIAGHRRHRFRHLERRSLPIPAKTRNYVRVNFFLWFFFLSFFPPVFFFLFFFNCCSLSIYLSIYLFFSSRSILSRASYSGRERKACSGGTAIWGGKGLGFFRAFRENPWGSRKKGMQINISMNYDTNCSGVNFDGLNCGWNFGAGSSVGFYRLWKCLRKNWKFSGVMRSILEEFL